MSKKIKISALILFTLFIGTIFSSGVGFTIAPTYTDDVGDANADYEDIFHIWIDNDNSYLQFKIELVGPFNQTLIGKVVYALISVDDATGDDFGTLDIKVDYIIGINARFDASNIDLNFEDLNNGSNTVYSVSTLDVWNSQGYFTLYNENKTVEMHYKLQTYDNDGKGYLNISLGQSIKIKFYAGDDSDYAPDIGEGVISYTLSLPSILTWILIGLAIGGAIVGVIFYALFKSDYL